jgi:hypothetical protein
MPRIVTAALVLLVQAPAAAQSRVEVTAAQEQMVRDRIDETAVYEASLNVCGDQTNVDERVIEAVEACVDRQVIDRLSEYWRNALAELGNLALVEENIDEFCADPELEETLTGYVAYIDDLVSQAQSFCTE